MGSVRIVRAGMFTSVQDCGRWGFQSIGVPVSGAMDIYSHRLANRIVGNRPDAATLEITLIGPLMEFDAATVAAVCGAEFKMTLDGAPVAMNRLVEAPTGGRLAFGPRVKGARAYVAFAGGGVLVPAVLHSRSTHVQSGMGGLAGRALRAGDLLPIGVGRGVDAAAVMDADAAVVNPLELPDGGATLRVIRESDADDEIMSRRFRISPQSDRMGYRLEGRTGGVTAGGERLSRPVPTGAIQVPASGHPIVLMADHATCGGYPIAGTIISADLPLAGQLAPGDWVEFEPCSLDAAARALCAQEAALERS